MNPLLSAKGGDITAWRAAENFTAAYRQAMLDLAASNPSGNAETVFSETCASIETAITTHQKFLKRLDSLIEEVSVVPSTGLAQLTVAFYSDLYRHFGIFRSAPAFYQLSMTFLRRASTTIIAQTTEQLGLTASHLPEMTLIAVGPAGRCEYSPFCPLQILLVHDEVAVSQLQTIDRFCHTLHAGFEVAGLVIDPVVTPRNERWRGTLAEWRQRFEDGLHPQADEELIDLCRLVDQYPLYPAEGFARELKQLSSAALNGNRSALINLIERMTSLSNGLGFMGRLKLERSGRERGMFKLLDHGLLPLSAALSALALIRKSAAASNSERIRDLLRQHELDVELAERILTTWHILHDLLLLREQSFNIDDHANQSLCLNPKELTDEQRQSLKEALESVAIIQRHVEIIFSGMGE
jgi:CBS domain-containing protein